MMIFSMKYENRMIIYSSCLIMYVVLLCFILVIYRQSGNTLDGDVPGNPVGELQEFTQKKLIKPPVYEFANEDGPPHNREFVCTVKLGKFTEKGEGCS